MNQNVVEFTDANFEQEVLQSSVPVLVDFWAQWCGPCRALGPTIEAIATEFADSARIGKLNIDSNPATAARFGIQSIPAVLLFKNGQLVESLAGVRPRERYEQAIQHVLAAA